MKEEVKQNTHEPEKQGEEKGEENQEERKEEIQKEWFLYKYYFQYNHAEVTSIADKGC